MAIIHYPGFISKEAAAHRAGIKVRAINVRMKKKQILWVKVDNWVFIKDTTVVAAPPPDIRLAELEWVPNSADRHRISPDRIYDQIILGKLTGVIVAEKIFVLRHDPALLVLSKIRRRA
jgi:hypothetical protein